MRNIALVGVVAAATRHFVQAAAIGCAISCAKHSDHPKAAYPPAHAPDTPVAPGTPAPASSDGTTPAFAATPAAAGPAAGVSPPALATPKPLPCTADAHCLTHRCNLATQKCAWPCQTDADCTPGNACITPTCLPKLQ